jgi:hypothetical protein
VKTLTRRGQPRAGGRRAIRPSTGIILIAAGAILLFAVKGSPPGLNLHVTGAILILTGITGLLLPPLALARPQRNRVNKTWRPAAADHTAARDSDRLLSAEAPGNHQNHL